MDELNNKLNAINKLIKQCENSKLESFLYQDKVSLIHFSKKRGGDYSSNLSSKVSMDNSSELGTATMEFKLEEELIAEDSEIKESEGDDIVTVVSSFVGTIEFSNQIKLGGDDIHINKGDVICSVEAMKLYNDIKSPVSGTIVEILVKDSSLVEYEQPILKIRVDKNE